MTRLVLGMALLTGLLTGGSGADEGKKDDVVKVDTRTLLDDYTKDGKAADQKYKGKVLQVEGVVASALLGGSDKFGIVYLEGGTDPKVGVKCQFVSDALKAVQEHNIVALEKQIKEKDRKVKVIEERVKVVINGTCKGKVKNFIVLDKCEVVEPKLLKK